VNTWLAHPSLDDLIDAQSAPAVRAHLAACPACEAEARSWNTAADVMRRLWASAQPPSWDPGILPAAADAGPADRSLARLARNHRVLAACTALILLAGGAYGAAAVLGGGRGPAAGTPGTRTGTTSAGITAVSGCSRLQAVLGTLQQAGSSSITIRTSSGRSVTVAVPASATVTRLIDGSLSGLSDGQRVIVGGTDDNGTLAAATVTLLPGSAPGIPRGAQTLPSGQSVGQLLLTLRHANGTVTGITGTGFTVAESDGTKVPVTTTGSTAVIMQVSSSPAQLRPGEQTVAVGTAGSNGTLTARQVEQLGVPTRQPGLPRANSGRPPAGSSGCSPASVATAELTSES
jgi:hypothetical protein